MYPFLEVSVEVFLEAFLVVSVVSCLGLESRTILTKIYLIQEKFAKSLLDLVLSGVFVPL